MTLFEVEAMIEGRLAAWRREEMVALAVGDETRAREARLRAGVLEQLRNDLTVDTGARRIHG
jgi:hypothetical protein